MMEQRTEQERMAGDTLARMREILDEIAKMNTAPDVPYAEIPDWVKRRVADLMEEAECRHAGLVDLWTRPPLAGGTLSRDVLLEAIRSVYVLREIHEGASNFFPILTYSEAENDEMDLGLIGILLGELRAESPLELEATPWLVGRPRPE